MCWPQRFDDDNELTAGLMMSGLAKKDDFRGITAKNADQKRFFSNFIG
jgi:hypothetical protein